ncbi:MAG: hypothetical protein IPF97_13580 [Sphingomonadales bacterium]|jgi:hypothetical protein|nr:hypothetical protein [Sphingomonadales bacterium]MBP7136527.1 hypothetical protein [Sphingomonadaceae bacterium]MBK6720456.1 hypothetical protein [Sphingomonadales bacterium]MBK8861854.1 hypothetical protein [Sphingomonadales bacterium]MBK9587674.1 hypothetical protein [Sphingomonadales bacterium]
MRTPIVTAFLGLLLLGAAVDRLGAEPPAEAAKIVRLPRGTEIKVRTDYGISSKAARVDDAVYLKVADAVAYNGIIVIPAGASVKGHVSEVTAPGGFGKTGSVVIDADYVIVGEDRIKISGSTAERGRPIGASVNEGVLRVPLGKGKNVNIEAGTLFLAYTEQAY